MTTKLRGKVFAFESARYTVAIQVGLTPKVIRFMTDDSWKQWQEVDVYVVPAGEQPPVEYVAIEGHTIDD